MGCKMQMQRAPPAALVCLSGRRREVKNTDEWGANFCLFLLLWFATKKNLHQKRGVKLLIIQQQQFSPRSEEQKAARHHFLFSNTLFSKNHTPFPTHNKFINPNK
jgi:hypothetical protein